MKKVLLVLLLLLVVGIAALISTMLPAKLDTAGAPAVFAPVVANPPAAMSLSIIKAGIMHSQDVFAYRGGKFGKERLFGADVALIRHPKGDLMIDSGFSSTVDDQVSVMPPLMKMLTKYSKETTVKAEFAKEKYPLSRVRGLILTHAHWDHVSGLSDLRTVPVWVTQRERDFIETDDEATTLIREIGALNYQIYDFPDGAYENYERSFDVYQDGAIVLVPMQGHTPGSTGIFVNLPSGKRYFFVGDLVWASEAIAIPAERPWLARGMVDADAAAVRNEIVRVHALAKQRPELIVVPAHDRAVFNLMAEFPAQEN